MLLVPPLGIVPDNVVFKQALSSLLQSFCKRVFYPAEF
jgi:hypothetical protein